MNDERKNLPDLQEEEEQSGGKFSLSRVFYHNTFVLIFSFSVAIISWFVMKAGDTTGNRTIYDVPIVTKLSTAAEEDGLRIFNMSYTTADLEIAGSSLITGKLTPDDFEVSVTLNPTSTKLTGNTLQKMTAQVRAVKKSSISDYTVVSISPQEINVEYDRYKEITIPIENEIRYSADAGFVTGAVSLTYEELTVSGPESSINKISRAVVNYSVGDPLRSDAAFSCPVRLLDQNNQEISDTASLYLELSVNTVDVNIPVLPKKTVKIKAVTLNQPKGFPDSRITVEPSEIEIAGTAEALSGISEITLDTPINFTDLEVSQQNKVTMDIPLPAGVRNVSASSENVISQATVSINLNGFRTVSLTVPAANISVSNLPAGKVCSVTTKQLEIKLTGSEAQVARITGGAVSIQADLTNYAETIGGLEVPVTVALSGTGVDSCWIVGKYTVSLELAIEQVVQANGEPQSGDAVNASPEE